MTNLLVELMRRNDPQARIPASLDRWEAEADRLLRLDGRTLDEARQVLEWAQGNDFWKGNILSMAKFREKFPALKLKMAGGVRGAIGSTPSAGDKYAHQVVEI